MKLTHLFRIVAVSFVLLVAITGSAIGAMAAVKETILHNFGQPDGALPTASVILDSKGNVYGTTEGGGSHFNNLNCSSLGCGVVFEIGRTASGIKETVLYNFCSVDPNCADGASPMGNLVFDSAGNLYGTAFFGGHINCVSQSCGTVFELTPNGDGTWNYQVIYSFLFGSDDGSNPSGGLIFDSAGNLYGTTLNGGSIGGGTVFELSPGAGGWTEKILYSFGALGDGVSPTANLVLDDAGNLYGTTRVGGSLASCQGGCGTVFQLTPQADGSWQESIIYSFIAAGDGAFPLCTLVFDSAGSLYGTSQNGAGTGGVVFKLTPSNGAWTESTLYTFSGGMDGGDPRAGVTFDKAGNLYGTTYTGGRNGKGVVFQLTPKGQERAFSLGSTHGKNPVAGVTLDSKGRIYGTTEFGGSELAGVAFVITH